VGTVRRSTGPVKQSSGVSDGGASFWARPTPGDAPPDLYDAPLPNGLQVQVYLDPARTGFNQLHATYLDQSGAPLPLTGFTVTQVVAGSSAAPLQLTSRRLDTGHYVAGSTVQKGSYVYTFTASRADQAPITLPVTIVVH
jgi:hypothetical protein